MDKYDSAFLGILQNEGDISKFLDCLFSFLYRKTDFYLLLKSPSDKLGFPSGVAKKLVLSAFHRYEALALQNEKRKEMLKERMAEKQSTVPNAVRTEEVTTTDVIKSRDETNVSDGTNSSTLSPIEASSPTDTASSINTSSTSDLSSQTTTTSWKDGATEPKHESPNLEENISDEDGKKPEDADTSKTPTAATNKTIADDDDPELTRLQKVFQANPESYNGAIRDNYCWSQSITDVDVRVEVPQNIRKGKEVTVEIGKQHLKVSYKGLNGQMEVAVDGQLTWECQKEESIWSLVPGKHIHVNLEKLEERWWDACFTNEPKISVRKIDPSRPMTDLDDEAQAKIEEMMYNEQQKRLGLPQSHEKKVHEMLAQAWDAEGSPFKGQPFDPSKVNVSPGGL